MKIVHDQVDLVVYSGGDTPEVGGSPGGVLSVDYLSRINGYGIAACRSVVVLVASNIHSTCSDSATCDISSNLEVSFFTVAKRRKYSSRKRIPRKHIVRNQIT